MPGNVMLRKATVLLSQMLIVFVVSPAAVPAQSSPSQAAVPSAAQMTRADIAVLEMVGGSALTAAERQQVAEAVDEGLQQNPKSWMQGYKNAQVALTLATYHNACADADSRENWRRDFANSPKPSRERDIMERHDPAVATLVGKGSAVTDIVSDYSLRVLAQTAAWANSRAGLPAPPKDLAVTARQQIQQGYATYPPELQTAYAHIGRNFASAAAMIALTKPAMIQPYMQSALAAKQRIAGATGPAAAAALVAQDLYNEVIRRGEAPVKLCQQTSADPVMQVYTRSLYSDAFRTMNPPNPK